MDNFLLRPPPAAGGMYRQNFATGKGGEFGVAGTFAMGRGELTAGVDGRIATHTSDISNPNNPLFGVANFNDVQRDLAGVFTEWSQPLGNGEIEIGARLNRVSASAGAVQATGMTGMMDMNVQALAADFNAAERAIDYNNFDVVAKYRQAVGDGAAFVVELGSKTRAPSYQELYLWLPLQATGGLADGRSYIGNLGLKAERSNEINIGFDASRRNWQISPHVFYKDVGDFIQGTPSSNATANMVSMMMSGQGALEFTNVDARIYGADLAWSVTATDRVTIDGIVSYARGKRTDVSDNLYRLAPLNGSVGANYAGDSWLLRSELVAYAAQDEVSAFNGETGTPGYGIVNLQFNWQPVQALRLELQAANLFDRAYQNHLSGTNRVSGVDIPAGVRLYGRGRTITAGFSLTF
jgi:iron complex outermembrane receptor protein